MNNSFIPKIVFICSSLPSDINIALFDFFAVFIRDDFPYPFTVIFLKLFHFIFSLV